MTNMRVITSVSLVALLAHALPAQDTPAKPVEPDPVLLLAKEHFAMVPPLPDNALQDPAVVLGRALFWDARLSANGQVACASCHAAADWGADRRRFSPDARGKQTTRNSQTVFLATRQPALRWTADRTSAAHQAEKSLTGSMGFAKPDDVVPLLVQHGHEPAFRRAFADDEKPVSPANYAKAIAAYEATLLTPSELDRFLGGEAAALDESQRRGLVRFVEIGCADCHGGELLGGRTLRKFGVERPYWEATGSEQRDAGRFESTGKEEDRHVFRVSMLRNVTKTAPYFHDGSVEQLERAVRVMAEVQLDEKLTDDDAAAITAFLGALTGAVPAHYATLESEPAKPAAR